MARQEEKAIASGTSTATHSASEGEKLGARYMSCSSWRVIRRKIYVCNRKCSSSHVSIIEIRVSNEKLPGKDFAPQVRHVKSSMHTAGQNGVSSHHQKFAVMCGNDIRMIRNKVQPCAKTGTSTDRKYADAWVHAHAHAHAPTPQ